MVSKSTSDRLSGAIIFFKFSSYSTYGILATSRAVLIEKL